VGDISSLSRDPDEPELTVPTSAITHSSGQNASDLHSRTVELWVAVSGKAGGEGVKWAQLARAIRRHSGVYGTRPKQTMPPNITPFDDRTTRRVQRRDLALAALARPKARTEPRPPAEGIAKEISLES